METGRPAKTNSLSLVRFETGEVEVKDTFTARDSSSMTPYETVYVTLQEYC